MSTGEKKPGVKDISDLKARLSSLNKGAKPVGPAGGASSAFGAPLDDQSDASIGAATAVVRIEPQASASAFGNEDQTEAIPTRSRDRALCRVRRVALLPAASTWALTSSSDLSPSLPPQRPFSSSPPA